MGRRRTVFLGEICGFGTTTGLRVVVGRWETSPFGTFADVMIETPDGTRTLIAPTQEVADYVQATYAFDAVCIVPVEATRTTSTLTVRAGDLGVTASVGNRSWIGRVMHLIPRRIAVAPWWATLTDPVARIVMRGVRTRGTAGNDRREWYGATDARQVVSITGTFRGAELGSIADVWPPVRFGFGSTPRKPSVVAVATTIEDRRVTVATPGSPKAR